MAQTELSYSGGIGMKLSTKSITLIVMILVLLVSTTVALAQQNIGDRAKRVRLKGQVTAVGENSFTLSVSPEANVTITVNDQTKIHLSRRQDEGRLSDIQVDSSVSIRGRQTDEASIEARLILVKPSQLRSRITIRGQVTAIKNDSFTLHARRGDFTILIDDSTQQQTRSRQEEPVNNLKIGSKVLVKGAQVEGQKNTIQAELIRHLRQRSK
jgi:hypothetical protein